MFVSGREHACIHMLQCTWTHSCTFRCSSARMCLIGTFHTTTEYVTGLGSNSCTISPSSLLELFQSTDQMVLLQMVTSDLLLAPRIASHYYQCQFYLKHLTITSFSSGLSLSVGLWLSFNLIPVLNDYIQTAVLHTSLK